MEMLNVNEAVVLRPPQQPEMQTPVEALPPVAPPEETATTLNYDHGASDDVLVRSPLGIYGLGFMNACFS
ncbi:hypothetical protein JHK82_031770 [Glycine max]|nr:hypothetical protein JHK82_031770 [Glycine max]